MEQCSQGRFRRLAQVLSLCAVPAVALAWFAPLALSALAISTTPAGSPLTEPVVPALASAPAAAELGAWEDTATLTAVQLVSLARKQSKALNDQVRALRAKLKSLKTNTFDYAITLQSLTLMAAERDAWDHNWRQVGRPGADLAALQNNLVNLQDQFVTANTQLQTLQAKEVQTGSVSSYTPPSF